MWSEWKYFVVSAATPITVDWQEQSPKPAWSWWDPEPGELATQWRTTPCVLDWNDDDLNDLVMLDHEGYLAFYERSRVEGELVLLPPKRLFKIEGPSEFDSRHRPVGGRSETWFILLGFYFASRQFYYSKR